MERHDFYGMLRENRICGSEHSQLVSKCQENGWLNCNADSELIFGADVDGKYDRALRKLGIDVGMLSNEAGHA